MNSHDLVLPPTEGEHHGAGVPAPAPTPPEPLTVDEYDAIVGTIWNGLPDDPFRIGDLLAQALGFIGGIALHDTDHPDADRATAVLRAMEQRSLWGPDQEQEDHR